MADPQLTPEQMQRLAEQQKKFNDQLEKTKDLLDSIEEVDEGIANQLKKQITAANSLNIKYGIGKDVLSKANKLQEEAEVKINILQQDRDRLLKKYAKARSNEAKEEIKEQLLLVTSQIKFNQSLEESIRLLQAAAEEEKKISEEKRKQNSLSETAKKYYNDNIAKQFSLLVTLKLLFDAAVRFNKVSVEIGKNLGYSADQADRVASNLTTMARNSGNLNFTLANAAEAMNQLNEATGLVTEYSADALETQIMLTKQFGLTADEAAGIYKFSVLTGQASSKVNDAMVGAFVAARNSFKVGANFKQVMAEAAKVSGQLAANLGYNPERITKAVVAMKAFGTTLEQTKNQGEALLNFESSIESELQAELITGQKLNLERAREAALMGDQVKLAEELTNQGMTLEKFQSMNVIAQKSYAEALGLSADQLSEQLQKQKLAIESGKSLAQLTKEEAIKAEERQNVQDKFNAAILKLQDLVGGLVAGPFGKLLEVITSILDSTLLLSTIMAVYIGRQTYLLTLKAAELVLTKKNARANAADAAVEAGKQASKVPVVGAVLGIAAAIAAFAAFSGLLSKGDDVISPGYGKRMIFSPEGAVALNNKDTIVAGTDLGGGGGEKITSSMDLTPMIAAINEVRNAVNNLASKSSDVVLDGQKVGKQLGTVKALGTSQVQNSYKLA